MIYNKIQSSLALLPCMWLQVISGESLVDTEIMQNNDLLNNIILNNIEVLAIRSKDNTIFLCYTYLSLSYGYLQIFTNPFSISPKKTQWSVNSLK